MLIGYGPISYWAINSLPDSGAVVVDPPPAPGVSVLPLNIVVSSRPFQGQSVFPLPIHNKTATAKVNGGVVTVASQSDSSVTLAVPVNSADTVEITCTIFIYPYVPPL
jgi:hypothetical protein